MTSAINSCRLRSQIVDRDGLALTCDCGTWKAGGGVVVADALIEGWEQHRAEGEQDRREAAWEAGYTTLMQRKSVRQAIDDAIDAYKTPAAYWARADGEEWT